MAGFIGMLGVAMVAAPGRPGGIRSTLPFIGIDPTGTMGQLLIRLYLTQDNLGTFANVSCDNAPAVIIHTICRPFTPARQFKRKGALTKGYPAQLRAVAPIKHRIIEERGDGADQPAEV